MKSGLWIILINHYFLKGFWNSYVSQNDLSNSTNKKNPDCQIRLSDIEKSGVSNSNIEKSRLPTSSIEKFEYVLKIFDCQIQGFKNPDCQVRDVNNLEDQIWVPKSLHR